jgi:hypothetical protein
LLNFLLKSNSKVSRVLPVSRKPACLSRRSRSRSWRLRKLVLDEGGEEIDGGELRSLCLKHAAFEAGGHPGAAELAERPLQVQRASRRDLLRPRHHRG